MAIGNFKILFNENKSHIFGDFERLSFVYDSKHLNFTTVYDCAEQVADQFFEEGYSEFDPTSLDIKSLNLEEVEEIQGTEIDNFETVVKKEIFPQVAATFLIDATQRTIQEIDESGFDEVFSALGSRLSLYIREYEPEG
jgi:hypothetical protein